MSDELAVRDSMELDWSMAARRAIASKAARDEMISGALVAGLDYGTIPGTNRPTLLKPGAEKVTDALGLWADYTTEQTVERTADDDALYMYRYRCLLRQRGSDAVVAAGIGTCSSLESRYRWRQAERVCPQCGAAAIIRGKQEYGGGWICWQKRDGCGAKYGVDDARIAGQSVERILNPDVHDCQNTVCKMAQKRALVAAVLNLGLSDKFTQDMEDAPLPAQPSTAEAPVQQPPVRQPQERAAEPSESAQTTLEAVEVASGVTHGKPWKRWGLRCADGNTYGTFSETLAETALALVGEAVTVCYEQRGQHLNARSIEPTVPL